MKSPSPLATTFRAWWKLALICACGIFLTSSIRPLLDGSLFRHPIQFLNFSLQFAPVMGAFMATIYAVPLWFRLSRSSPAGQVLEEVDNKQNPARTADFTGFMAMEYFALIWNRTFAVFVGEDGIYGWQVCGVVTNSDPEFYQPWAEMLKEPTLMQDLDAVRKLSQLRGGFFIPRATISEVLATDKPKWGMGGIVQSGRVTIRTTDGRNREFILLGYAIPEEVRDHILHSTKN